MPRSMQEIIDHADQLAAQFEAYEPSPEDEVDLTQWGCRPGVATSRDRGRRGP